MVVGATHYITRPYNQESFQFLLEDHLKNRKNFLLNTSLIEQCISAMLECRDLNSSDEDVKKMDKLLDSLNVKYADFRDYESEKKVKGNPKDAVLVFLELLQN